MTQLRNEHPVCFVIDGTEQVQLSLNKMRDFERGFK